MSGSVAESESSGGRPPPSPSKVLLVCVRVCVHACVCVCVRAVKIIHIKESWGGLHVITQVMYNSTCENPGVCLCVGRQLFPLCPHWVIIEISYLSYGGGVG